MRTFRSWAGKDESDAETLATIWKLAGKPIRLSTDNFDGITAVHYEEAFPDDFAPLLILDASGLLRETYSQWFRNRGGLHRLPSPQKDFTRLQIGHWDHAAGRSGEPKALKEQWDKIADGVAEKILHLPEADNVLIVHFLPSSKIGNFEHRLTKRVRGKRIKYTTWGEHTATNDYRDCKHIVLAGVLQLPSSAIEAYGRGAKGIGPFAKFTEDEHRETRLGEIKHNILQAACRGMIRQSDGNQCPEGCMLHVVYSSQPRVGIPREILGQIFPGAKVSSWLPLGSVERPKPPLHRLLDFLKQRTEPITAPALAKALHEDPANLNKRLKMGAWQYAINQIGWKFIPGRKGGKSVPGRFERFEVGTHS